MKILITGATGFIGQNLIKHLIDHDHQVVALSRNPDSARERMSYDVPYFRWDYKKQEIDIHAFEDVQAVIHLAGENIADSRWTEQKKKRISDSRELGTTHLVNTMRELNMPPEVFISTSAIGYYGDRGDESLTESSPPGTGFLAETCQRWEACALKAEKFIQRICILRIGVVLGKGGGALEKMLPIFRMGVGGKLGNGKQWMSWIHIEDLCRLFLFLLGNNNTQGTYNGSSPSPVTNAEFTKVLARQLGRPAIFRVPEIALKLGAGEMGGFLLASTRVVPQKAIDDGFTYTYRELETALSELVKKKTQEFRREQFINKPLKEVFAFFSEAQNLERITPPFLHFKILSMSTDTIGEGTEISYRLKLHGLPVTWKSRIEEWDPPNGFVDLQLKGPYKYWLHRHQFEEKNRGTLIRDIVNYQLPFEPVSQILAGGMVERDVQKIFTFRRNIIQKIFSGE